MHKELTLIRIIHASPERVWSAWTDPKALSAWWGPKGVTTPICEFDARPGGMINIVMLAGKELGDLEGNEWPMTGVVVEIEKPTKLVFSGAALVDGKPVLETMNTVTLEEHEGKTKLTLHIVVTKTTPDAEGPLAGMEIGWNQSLDKLNERFI